MAVTDVDRDNLMSRIEYLSWLNRLTGGSYTAADFASLPASLKALYTTYATAANGEIDINGVRPGTVIMAPTGNLDAMCNAAAAAFATASTGATATTGSAIRQVATSTPGTTTPTPTTATATATATPIVPGAVTTTPVLPGTFTSTPALPGATTTSPVLPGTVTTTPVLLGAATTTPILPGATTPATVSPATGTPGGSTAPGTDMKICTLNMAISDADRDNLISETEYITFLNRMASGKYANITAFASLPQPLQDSYNGLLASFGAVPGSGLSILGASPTVTADVAQTAFLQQICAATDQGLQNVANGGGTASTSAATMGSGSAGPSTVTTGSANPGTAGPSTSSPGGVAAGPVGSSTTSPTTNVDTCKVQMAIADGNKNSLLSVTEYITFLNRLANNQWLAITTLADLPSPLQTAFNTLALGNEIDITGANPAQPATEAQLLTLQSICASVDQAINAANNSSAIVVPSGNVTSTPNSGTSSTLAPSGPVTTTGILGPTVDTAACKSRMVGADTNPRDSQLNVDEYFLFVNLLTANRYGQNTFTTLPRPIQENFNLLVNSATSQIPIFGANPVETGQATAEQLSTLNVVCSATNNAILESANNTGPSTTTAGPSDNATTAVPGTGAETAIPTGPTSTPTPPPIDTSSPILTIHSAFQISSALDLSAELLNPPAANRHGLEDAYKLFVETVVPNFLKELVGSSSNLTTTPVPLSEGATAFPVTTTTPPSSVTSVPNGTTTQEPGSLPPGTIGPGPSSPNITAPPIVTFPPSSTTSSLDPGEATTPVLPWITTMPVLPGAATVPAVPGATTSPAIPGAETTAPSLQGATTAPISAGATTAPVLAGAATATPGFAGATTTAPVLHANQGQPEIVPPPVQTGTPAARMLETDTRWYLRRRVQVIATAIPSTTGSTIRPIAVGATPSPSGFTATAGPSATGSTILPSIPNGATLGPSGTANTVGPSTAASTVGSSVAASTAGPGITGSTNDLNKTDTTNSPSSMFSSIGPSATVSTVGPSSTNISTMNPSATFSTLDPSATTSAAGPSSVNVSTSGTSTLVPDPGNQTPGNATATNATQEVSPVLGLSLSPNSARLIRFEDKQCGAGVTATSCLTVFAQYDLLMPDGIDHLTVYDALVTRTQQAIDNGGLRLSLLSVNPNSDVNITGASFAPYVAVAMPAAPSSPPTTAAPTSGEPGTEEATYLGLSLGAFIAILLVLIVVTVLACGCFAYVVYTLRAGDNNVKNDGPTKEPSDNHDHFEDEYRSPLSQDDSSPPGGFGFQTQPSSGSPLFKTDDDDDSGSDEERPSNKNEPASPAKAEFGYEIGGPGEFNVGMEDENWDDSDDGNQKAGTTGVLTTNKDGNGLNTKEKAENSFFATESNGFFGGGAEGWGKPQEPSKLVQNDGFGFQTEDASDESDYESQEDEGHENAVQQESDAEESEDESNLDDEGSEDGSDDFEREQIKEQIIELVRDAAPHEVRTKKHFMIGSESRPLP
jgi:hypothetical protein